MTERITDAAIIRELQNGPAFRIVPGDSQKEKVERRFGLGTYSVFVSLVESGEIIPSSYRTSRGKVYTTYTARESVVSID